VGPRLKLAWYLLILSLVLSASEPWLVALGGALSLGLSLMARLPGRPFLKAFPLVMLVGGQVLLLHLLFNTAGDTLFTVAFWDVHVGAVWAALRAWLRLACLMVASLQLYLWLRPGELVHMLAAARIPYRYATLAGLALRFLPEMEHEFRGVVEAQAARGLPVQGTFARLRAFLPLALPFLFRVLRRADDVALSLELRGFGAEPQRTFLEGVDRRRGEAAAAAILGLAAVVFAFTPF
jgi:energy-coupling factor transport system permease protein